MKITIKTLFSMRSHRPTFLSLFVMLFNLFALTLVIVKTNIKTKIPLTNPMTISYPQGFHYNYHQKM
jgi:hypothetical protein